MTWVQKPASNTILTTDQCIVCADVHSHKCVAVHIWAQACDANITSIWCNPIQWHIAVFFTIREQPTKSTSDAFWLGFGAEGQLSAVFLNSPTGFSDKRFWMRSHNQTGSARAQKPLQFQKARYSIFYELSDAITRGRLCPKSVTAPSSPLVSYI